MFYQKADIEILCDALIKLSDKQERFMEKFGASIKSPYTEAMHAIMSQIETHYHLASKPKDETTTSVNISTEEIIKSAALSAKEKIDKKKQSSPTTPRRQFKQPAKITVGIGHSDDPGMKEDIGDVVPKKAVGWAQDDETKPEPAIVKKEQVVMITEEELPEKMIVDNKVTSDNIDALAENLMDKFEPREANLPRATSLPN